MVTAEMDTLKFPVTLVHRRDAQPDGTHAGWVTATGPMKFPLTPNSTSCVFLPEASAPIAAAAEKWDMVQTARNAGEIPHLLLGRCELSG